MSPIATILIVFFTLFLAACGGGSPTSESGTPDTGSGDGSSVSPGTVDPVDPTSPNVITNIGFGSGVGQDFKPGEITLDNSYSLLAGTLQVSVNVVDKDSANAAVAQDYQFEFSSTCSTKSPAQASFSVSKFGSASGSAATTYRNISCRDSDTLTVKLLSKDGSKELATAKVDVPAYVPQLGFGSGAEYIDGKINGQSILLIEPSTILKANAVDVANINELISDENYTAVWRSSCAASTFSITSQNLASGSLVTRYDANSCKGVDVVTLTVYATKNLQVALDSISMNMQVGPVVDNAAVPVLSNLTINNEYVLAGSSLEVAVKGVDSASDSALSGDYIYQFLTSCVDGSGSFESALKEVSSGEVSNVFNNKSCTANDGATLTVNLFVAGADVENDAPINTLSTTFKTAFPQLGFGSGADFVTGKIDGNTNLIDNASTKLTVNAVDVLNLNSLIDSDNYVAKWSASCAAATFSIESQSLSTSNIVTRYDANSCTGNDTVTVKLFAKNNLLTELNRATLSLTISSTAGVAVDAKLNSILLSKDHALAGESLVLSVKGIDVQNDSALLTNNYVYTFESSCSGTSFAQASIQSNTGKVNNTYINTQCGPIGNDSTDTLTVKLYDASDLTFATALDTKTITINTSYPKLGFGSGADFVDGLISGQAILVNSLSSKLSANAIDALNLNTKISGDNYSVVWSSSCVESSFSITSQSLVSGSIDTRYDANSCVGTDIVTLSLYARNDLNTRLDHMSLTMNIGDSAGVDVEPKIGFGNGSDFSEGSINLSADYVLAGSSVTIIVNGVNSKDNNTLLDGNYLYKFESSCTTANNARFSSAVIANNNGTIYNTYDNRMCQAEDTITVSLFAEGSDTALTTASAVIATALPKLGYKSGADFIEGIIEGNYNLVDAASTFLSATVIDPLNVNSLLSSSNYYIEWQANCASAKFSIESQSISSLIKTRYDGDADLCPNDTVTLTLFNQLDDELDSITASISINESLIPAKPALGSGAEGTFVTGDVMFSETDIAARQTIEVSVNIVDSKASANTLITGTEYAVSFDSVCVKDGRASFDKDQVRTTSGIARVYYTASGCTENDTINAVLYAVNDNVVDNSASIAVASSSINIELPQVNSIEYQGMSSRQIALQGISFTALPEVTEVNFVIKDEFNQPISGKEVTFSLSNASVDATLSGDLDSDGEVVASTNASGVVTAYVNSGQTHGLVSVLAVTEKNGGGVLRTQSFGISITTGIPVQPSFSLALDTYNPRGWNVNGETVSATVQLADRFHNPVPDGTIVNFITDGGIIEPRCETANGACSVNWRSANPRPGFSKDNSSSAKQKSKTKTEHPTNDISSQFYFNGVDDCDPTDLAAPCNDDRYVEVDSAWNGGRSGVVTIVAYVEGEVDFADGNGNGRFDDGEDFSPMAEAYLDANENGTYDVPDEHNPFEQLIEYVEDGVLSAAPTTYQGGSCTEDTRNLGIGHCASLVHIRKEVQLVMSSDAVAFKIESIVGKSGTLTNGECIDVYDEGPVTFNFLVNDYNGNIPIADTALTFEADFLKVSAQPNAIANEALTEAVAVPIIVRTDDKYAVDHDDYVTLSAKDPDGGVAGFITIENVVDDPRIFHTSDAYLLDVSGGDQAVTYTFKDACGKPPKDDDLILFEMANGFIGTGGAGVKVLQVRGDQLTGTGTYDITFTKDGTTSVGELAISTINASGGDRIYTNYDVRD